MAEDEKHNSNPISNKFIRSNGPHKPTENSDVFFGLDYFAKILEVTDAEIRYIDNNGTEKNILFNECKKNSEHNGFGGYIAKRGLLTSPPWVEFFDENKTRFEFELRKDAQFFVWDMLSQKGFKTIDMD